MSWFLWGLSDIFWGIYEFACDCCVKIGRTLLRRGDDNLEIFTKIITKNGWPHSIYVVAAHEEKPMQFDDCHQELHRVDCFMDESDLNDARYWAADKMASDLKIRKRFGYRSLAGGWCVHEKAP